MALGSLRNRVRRIEKIAGVGRPSVFIMGGRQAPAEYERACAALEEFRRANPDGRCIVVKMPLLKHGGAAVAPPAKVKINMPGLRRQGPAPQ